MYSNYIITKDKAYALINYEEIIAYHKLPFYKKWFTKQPLKELTELKSEPKPCPLEKCNGEIIVIEELGFSYCDKCDIRR